jgi:cell division protein ZapE
VLAQESATSIASPPPATLAGADAEPTGLYPSGDGSFEFQRTVSRLEETRSAEYLALGHGTVT